MRPSFAFVPDDSGTLETARTEAILMRTGSLLSGSDLISIHSLSRSYSLLNKSALRLSTLNRINRGADDPAALIAVETLRSELTAIEAANSNAARAAGAIRAADSAMSEVGKLLNSIRGNVLEASGGLLSNAEMEAKQIEINAAVEAVNRISSYTSYGGRRLLDGSAERMVLNFSPSAADTSVLSLPNVHSTHLGGASGSLSEITTGGSLSLASGNFSAMIDTLNAARDQVFCARAEAGAFEKYSIESSMRVLDQMEESITEGISRLLDTDAAQEASNFLRAQILVETGLFMVEASMRSRGLIRQLLA
jgi:flagellin-like hook-associated protein FlgL